MKDKRDEVNLICESDDFVFIFYCDYNSRDFSGSEWFPNPDQRRMQKYGGDFLREICDCYCVDTNHYKRLTRSGEERAENCW